MSLGSVNPIFGKALGSQIIPMIIAKVRRIKPITAE
jgi:hypothetical protein